MAQITYADKTALYENQDIQPENKVRDVDMNEIKEVVNDNETKILLAVVDTAPATCDTGDMYFNTTNNLIYTATATNTWGSTGVVPTENTIYVVIDTQTSYVYNGTTLISVGGGSGGIVVAPDTPTEDTQLYIESTDLDGQYLPVEEDIYSTTETKTNKVWIDGKPIYRKCYNITEAISANTEKTFGSDTNIDVIICIYGVMTRSNGNDFQINSYDGQNYCFARIDRATNHSFLIKSSLAGTGAFVVTEYTKTS